MSDNIKVVVKVRPLISREIEDKLCYQWRVKNNTLYQLDQNGKDLGQSFTFDKVYDKDTKTSDVYEDIAKPIVQAATAGFNGTIFAYGQTSSGKTYTMTGTESSPGIIPLAVLNLFEIIKNVPDRDFLVRVSYIEIYNETVKDLLNVEKDNIKIHETFQGIKVDATERVTSSPEEVLEAMKEGEANRQKGATNMNEESSRSHSIFQITIESREHIEGEEEVGCVNVSQLNLVDLAGSERAGQTGATGKRFKEGTHINKSLSALALVIKQLSEDPNKYANYRDSKLTRILQNSLGGNAKTSIICAITPAAVEETISTLQFANRAKAIKNKPEVNAVATDATMIQSLTKQMCKLQAQLESKKNLEQDFYKLQNKIANLQKVILNGFAQRRSMELIDGTRRKLQQPRRITISTLHSIEDEPVVSVPKFCTPSLKYNPSLIPNPADFAPIQAPSKLASVPEEPCRLVTPPPTRTVNFNDEVIELDSDDDDSTREDIQTCSPIHKCYGSSKTPPCILRRNAKVAEKNLKEIVELTEREKVYTPSVVEYIEKLEHNTTIITKLEDEIKAMKNQTKEKDLEMEHLKSKMKKSEQEIEALNKIKMDLQSQCDKFSTKVTDLEVSYETLRNKAKLREEELLSLLEELTVRNKKPNDIGKILSRTLDKEIQFMDMSKDISLVNSDNDSSVINTNDDEIEKLNEIVKDTQLQLTSKNQTIIDLEADLFSEKQKILSLESLNKELQEQITTFKDKLANMGVENSLLKSTIDTLNSTIQGQKENLESANNDIESYNSVIQELQIKVLEKNSLPDININDSVLENMIANEEKFIANNENMKNIIHSLKIALDSRNREIDKLKKEKSVCHEVVDSKALTEELDTKINEVISLNAEIEKLKKDVNENIEMINKLIHENNDLKVIEQVLASKVANIEEKNTELEKLNRENHIHLEKLIEENNKLKSSLTDKNITGQEISNINKQLVKEIEFMTEKIADLQNEISEKDDRIYSLAESDKESKESLVKAKEAAFKAQVILGTLSGNIQEVPDVIDNFVNIFSVLSDSMNTLENAAKHFVAQKEEAIKNNIELKQLFEEETMKHKSKILALQQQIDNFTQSEIGKSLEYDTLIKQMNQLNQVLNNKITENETLAIKLDEAEKHIDTCNQEIIALKSEKSEFSQNVMDKENVIENLTLQLRQAEKQLKDKTIEINDFQKRLNNIHKEKDDLLKSIFAHMIEFTTIFNIRNDINGELVNDCKEIHRLIILTLDNIGNHIRGMIPKNFDNYDQDSEISLEAKNALVELTQQNLDLKEQLSETEIRNTESLLEIKRIQNENKTLNKELFESQKILESLDREVKLKSTDLSKMETKVKDWKEQFNNLDYVMKQQMYELQLENEELKGRIAGVNKDELSVDTYEHIDSYQIEEPTIAVKKQHSETTNSLSSPPSLLTIVCNKIIDSIQPKEIDSRTTTINSNVEPSVRSDQTYVIKCKCDILSSELKAAREENTKVMDLLVKMEELNQQLVQEQEAVRTEIQLLVGPAEELKKMIFNHKTNLSILTAITNTENRSLKSQIKMLQHHHTRFHNVCQRDIPDFKKQLSELMTLLKGNPYIGDQQNTSVKRYSLPDVLDSSTTLPNFKNESTLDGDLLMLDTNITMTTTADNTMVAHNQSCLDLTQLYHEVCCQTDMNQMTDENIERLENLTKDYNSMSLKLNMLRDENETLRELLEKYTKIKQFTDAQCSPVKEINSVNDNLKNTSFNDGIHVIYECAKCKNAQEKFDAELKALTAELLNLKSQNIELEQKYNNLMLEIPSTDLLVKKLGNLEKDYNSKKQEIAHLNNTLNVKNQELKRLQEENDTLSVQVMENISEADDLNKELEILKQKNIELIEKCNKLENFTKEFIDNGKSNCAECLSKDELIQTMQMKLTHTRLNRSLSDSDTSSRYNKICTLQNELHAGKEDCKELTEDVITIKNHLERGNISIDLDDSMGESHLYTFPKEYNVASPQSDKCIMPDIPEERTSDLYKIDKLDCINYYAEKSGVSDCEINSDIKIIELMKMFYQNLVIKHGNEVENLTNKLKDYEESKSQIEIQFHSLLEKHSQLTAELNKKDESNAAVANVLSQIKNNIDVINKQMINDNGEIINVYKDNVLKILDNEFDWTSVNIFETLIDRIVNKHQTDLAEIMERYTKLQMHMDTVSAELNSVNENLAQMKTQLSDKENEYNLLKAQKERIHEISNAVTLDIVQKDKELNETLSNGYKRLIELNILNVDSIDLTLPLSVNVNLLFERLVNEHENRKNSEIEKEKELLVLEVKSSKQLIEEKDKEIELLRTQSEKIIEINKTVTIDLVDKNNKLESLKALQEDLNKIYESKVEENNANVSLIEKLSEEIKLLMTNISANQNTIAKLEMEIDKHLQCREKDIKITELVETIKGLQDDIAHLKTINEIITKEKDEYASELIKSGETIKQNNLEMDRMTSDILILRESVKENGTVIENLNVEAKNLLKQNMELKAQLEERSRECFRLETNIKTHEKTAEIQSRMIMRLEKQKNEDDKAMSDKNKQLEELTQKCAALQKQCDAMQNGDSVQYENLKRTKEALEARVLELEALLEVGKPRPSIDAIADSSRRRRQSLYDSKRVFSDAKQDLDGHHHVEAIFDSRPKPDDLFMDVDDEFSNRSTPVRLSKGRESLSISRTDQSDKDEEHPSRPSSVVATRRRRQSSHDLHRSVLRHTPSPHGLESSYRIHEEFNHSKPCNNTSGGNDSEVSQLRERLANCQQELEDLKEKYRELDEECETCAEYLRERDEQCIRLKKERSALQATIEELKEKLQTCNPNTSQQNATKPIVANVAVNTDEDWTNLHSVVVDRMSYDAEVEKNKRLTKTIEELRFQKQDLKNTLSKMQKALEKNNDNRELISTRLELQACKQELMQLREKYKELDEECETCAQYLREKEDQCRRLKEAKATLEAKLQEFEGDLSAMTQTARKKRQSVHDQNRDSAVDFKDASTETSDDFLSYQVERDGSYRPLSEGLQAKEMNRLKMVVERLSQQKAMLEQQLVSMSAAMHATHPAMYVATGSAIVQNQQLTDVMKENQKLKKINAKLVHICKKRGKDSNRENEDPADQG